MKIDVNLINHSLDTMTEITRSAEALGFDGIWTSETSVDPFLPLVLAAEHSRRLTLGTAIALAFPRNPGTLAYIAWELARYSRGRFILGLGSQVRAHIERRFGVEWESPVEKLREMILAIRAYWDCWQNGGRLNFKGNFFRLSLMTPFFSPEPIEHPRIPIYVSAINRRMLHMAGEVCDGVHLHALHTVPYIKEFALPHIESGLAESGRIRDNFTLTSGAFVIPTGDPEKAAAAEAYARQQLSFYMSTPAYRVVLEMHGWADLSLRLSRMARRGQWSEMPGLITDEVMEACAITGTWAEIPAKIVDKYGGLLDRVSLYLPFVPGENDAGWRAVTSGFRQLRQN